MSNKIEWRKELIKAVEHMGRDVAQHATEIVGDMNYMTDLTITLHPSVGLNSVPTITVEHEYLSHEKLKSGADMRSKSC